jgi:hypothetical protein
VQITLNTSRLSAGEVAVDWNILEQNDGGVVQIVYAGDETVDIQGHAVIEGQPELVELRYGQELRSPGEEYARRRGMRAQLPTYVIIAMGLVMSAVFVWHIARRRGRGQQIRISDLVMAAQGPAMVAVGIWALLTQRPPGPPFGF